MWINEQTKGVFILHSDIRYELWKAGKEAPGVLTDEFLVENGYPKLTQIPIPYDPMTQGLTTIPPTQNEQGEWEQTFVPYELDAATIANNQNTAEVQRVSGIRAQMDSLDIKQIRALREITKGVGDVVGTDGKTPRQHFADREAQIEVLRLQL